MIKLPELLASVSEESPEAVAGITDRGAIKLMRAVFAKLAREIDQAPDGAFQVSGFGTFRVLTAEAKEGGKGGGRRVLFRAQKPKADKGGA